MGSTRKGYNKGSLKKNQITQKKFAKCVQNSGGVLQTIADRLGCTRQGLELWVKRDANRDFAKPLLEQAREQMLDIAENSLFDQVHNQEQWAVKFFLATQGKTRGYVERQEQVHSGEMNQNHKIQIELVEVQQQEVIDVEGKESTPKQIEDKK